MEKSRTIASDELLMEQFYDQEWNDLWIKLTARSVYILRIRYGVTWSKSRLETFCHQIIMEVIEKVFIEKTRKWNTEKYPYFLDFIIGVVDSHINNTLNKDIREVSYDNNVSLNRQDVTSSDAQQKLSTVELRNQLFDELKNADASDEELMIFECLADGICRPKEIKQELGITDEEFHNIWRRFKRKREIIRKKLLENGD